MLHLRLLADAGRRGIVAGLGYAAGHREQLAHRHLALRGHELTTAVRLFHRDARALESGQVCADGVPQLKKTLLIKRVL